MARDRLGDCGWRSARTKWRMGMSKVKLAIEVATGASCSVEVSSETMEKEELAREIIDVLRRHFPISGTSMIYDQARSRSPYDDVRRTGYLNRRTRWTWWAGIRMSPSRVPSRSSSTRAR